MLRTTDGFAGRCGIHTVGGLSPFVTFQAARPNTMRVTSNATCFGADKSLPQGYNREYAISYPLKVSGQIAATITGEGNYTASIGGIGNIAAAMAGEGNFTAFGNVLSNAYAAFVGEGNFVGAARATGNLSALFDLGNRPSAFDVSQQVWFGTSLDGLTMHKIMQVLVAVAAGRTDIDTSGSSPVITFRDLQNTVDRVEATMMGSERSDVIVT
jgi:hypothetical protein